MTTTIQEIPLSKLVPSSHNVRRTAPNTRVEELAASIAAHGLLQNLTVMPVLREPGSRKKETFEVVAGGRRLAALKLLAKRKLIAKDATVLCHVREGNIAEEISLAENALQCPVHPADQFEAFAKLHNEQGMSAEDMRGATPRRAVSRSPIRMSRSASRAPCCAPRYGSPGPGSPRRNLTRVRWHGAVLSESAQADLQ